ncbi:MAG: hypothetical protein ATN35_01735 [Epulopiscium sp. Nele67-Bin004]|nr:MAG: hypothetical protein ATN35_01735 [Epulopiscium sp. Nele67-Bin004]
MLQNFKSLLELTEYFKSEKDCQEYFSHIRWNGKPVCPYCQHNKVYTMSDNRYKCSCCGNKFTVKVGTIFENSKISLKKWFVAIFLLSTTKKGISSIQLSKELGITQKSAWYMIHRIREAVIGESQNKLNGIIEVDETYIGGKESNKHNSKKQNLGRGVVGKEIVLGMVQRGGNVRAFHIDDTKSTTLERFVKDNVAVESIVFTDEHKGYAQLVYPHYIVKHSHNQYVSGDVHTNTIEGFWSLVKRSVVGIYHYISPKHLNRYLQEFTHRYNHKTDKPSIIMNSILKNSIGKRLPYSVLIGE